jgi:hypothetical protein
LDAYLKQDKPDDRKGTDSELRVKTETGKLNRALLRFDLAGVPGTATVASLRLWLWVKDLNGPALAVSAHGVEEGWNEAEVTWSDRDRAQGLAWSEAGGRYGATVSSAVVSGKDVWVSWDLAALGAGWLAGANEGVLLEAPAAEPKTEVKFLSSDDSDAQHRPLLELCYWP